MGAVMAWQGGDLCWGAIWGSCVHNTKQQGSTGTLASRMMACDWHAGHQDPDGARKWDCAGLHASVSPTPLEGCAGATVTVCQLVAYPLCHRLCK